MKTEAKIFIDKSDKQYSSSCYWVKKEAIWNYETNVTEFNMQKMIEEKFRVVEIRRRNWSEATRFRWRSFGLYSLRRIFSMTTVLGNEALPHEERNEYEELLQNMTAAYSEAKICPYNPDKTNDQTFLKRPRTTFVRNNNDFRDHVFLEEKYQLQSQFTRNNDSSDYKDRTEDLCLPTLRLEPDLEHIMAKSRNPEELLYVWRAWREASGRPLRRRYLRFIEMSNKAARINGFKSTTDFWQRDYESDNLNAELDRVWDEIKPFYEQLHAYVRRKLKERYGDQYFGSDGTIPVHLLAEELLFVSWIQVHFRNLSGYDQCWLNLRIEKFIIIYISRDGANPSFQEAVSDAISLSVATTSYMTKIGLLSTDVLPYKDNINSLFTTALNKIVYLPFTLVADKWRWKVFDREVEFRDMNTYWWQLKFIYQGISPPVFRSPLEFDPGSKYHIVAHKPYLRYFIAYILKFQIHEELCLAAGHKGDLQKCNIYGSKAAGTKLQNLLRLGKSKPWRRVLSDFSDGRINQLNAGPLLRYFKHLQEWLVKENRDYQVGWYSNQTLFAPHWRFKNISSAAFIGILVGALALFSWWGVPSSTATESFILDAFRQNSFLIKITFKFLY
ncbi:Angiotensin-converting enzyme [Armadillidium vulgare]|nr:Angiotensin-converting enzyme [Armadillidium vulgare]